MHLKSLGVALAVCVAFVSLAGLVLVGSIRGCPKRRADGACFASAEELLRLAKEDGLHCYPGSPMPNHASGHYVTDRPEDPNERQVLCKGQWDDGDKWQGVVWVCDLDSPETPTGFAPENVAGAGHVLGRVFVAGDRRLIARIEEMGRQQAQRERGE